MHSTGDIVFYDDDRGIIVGSYPSATHRGISHDVYWPVTGRVGEDVWDSDLITLERYAELIQDA